MQTILPQPPYQSATATFDEKQFRKANRIIINRNISGTLLGGLALSALIAVILSFFVFITTVQHLHLTFIFVAAFAIATGLLWPFAVLRSSLDNYAKQLRNGTLTIWLSETHIIAGNSTTTILRCFPFNDTIIYAETPEFFVIQCGPERLIVMRSALQSTNIESELLARLPSTSKSD